MAPTIKSIATKTDYIPSIRPSPPASLTMPSSSGLSLLTDAGNFRAFKILIAAEYNGIVINVPDFKLTDTKSAAFLAKNPKVNNIYFNLLSGAM